MNVFVRVAEADSFARAAESLDVAQASVTHAVRSLEQHLGIPLFDRGGRGLRLTPQGELYLERARSLLEALEHTDEELRARVGEARGALHLESIIALGHHLLFPQLCVFARRHPEIRLEVTLSNEPHNIIEHAVDVAIRFAQVEDAELVARPLYEMQYVVCCTPEMARGLPAHPADLDRRVCLGVLPEERFFPNAWQLSRAAEDVEIRPDGPLHFNNGADVLVAAQRGAGVACVLDALAARWLADGSLVQVYPEWRTPAKTLYVVIPKSRVGSAKVRVLVDFLFEVFDALPRPSARAAVGVKRRGRR